MHFQVINDEYYEGILEQLRSIVPEFNSVFDQEDGIYPILGEFGTYIIDHVEDMKILKESAQFINESILKGKNKTEDVIVLQLFQKLYENSIVAQKIRGLLNNESKSIFDRYFNDYNRMI